VSAASDLLTYVTTADHWWGGRGIANRTVEHLRLSLVSVGAAALVTIPVAAWLGHVRRGGVAAQWLVNVGRAVPSLAVLSLVLPFALRYGFGLGFWPTFVALFLLAIPALFTNTYLGIRTVDADVVEAARGMGLRPVQVLIRVELPSALPVVAAGARIATLQVIATATLGAYVGFDGLGSFINEGFRQQDDGKLLTGALAVSLVALAVDAVLGAAARRAMPWRQAITTAPPLLDPAPPPKGRTP
jgi:osmoprotectant transport system permease protein